MIIGTRMTGNVFKKMLEEIIEKSPTAKSLKKFITKIDKLQEEGKIDKLLLKVQQFFDEATELVSSPEAKNFFKNVTALMKELGEESDVKLNLPKKGGEKHG